MGAFSAKRFPNKVLPLCKGPGDGYPHRACSLSPLFCLPHVTAFVAMDTKGEALGSALIRLPPREVTAPKDRDQARASSLSFWLPLSLKRIINTRHFE